MYICYSFPSFHTCALFISMFPSFTHIFLFPPCPHIGIVGEPVRGLSEEGVIGLGTGVIRGIVGAVVKPAAGVLDCVSELSAGLRCVYELLTSSGCGVAKQAEKCLKENATSRDV